MLDFDPAMLYGIETKVLKQAVRRNMKRFEGEDFMFEVTREELSRSQFVTLNSDIRRLLEEYIEETEEKFDEVYAALTELAEHRKSNPPKPRNPIGYRK